MSANAWIATAILGVAVAYLGWFVYKLGTEQRVRDERDPEAPRNVERGRAASEAAAAAPAHAPLSDADAAEVAELHGYFQEIGTGEHPKMPAPTLRRRHVQRPPSERQLTAMRVRALAPVRHFEANPLAAPIPGRHRFEEPALFADAAVDWFSSSMPPETAAAAYPALPADPDPWLLDGPTGVWSVGWIDSVLAKAEASR